MAGRKIAWMLDLFKLFSAILLLCDRQLSSKSRIFDFQKFSFLSMQTFKYLINEVKIFMLIELSIIDQNHDPLYKIAITKEIDPLMFCIGSLCWLLFLPMSSWFWYCGILLLYLHSQLACRLQLVLQISSW